MVLLPTQLFLTLHLCPAPTWTDSALRLRRLRLEGHTYSMIMAPTATCDCSLIMNTLQPFTHAASPESGDGMRFFNIDQLGCQEKAMEYGFTWYSYMPGGRCQLSACDGIRESPWKPWRIYGQGPRRVHMCVRYSVVYCTLADSMTPGNRIVHHVTVHPHNKHACMHTA
jgi:hypothetical protein